MPRLRLPPFGAPIHAEDAVHFYRRQGLNGYVMQCGLSVLVSKRALMTRVASDQPITCLACIAAEGDRVFI